MINNRSTEPTKKIIIYIKYIPTFNIQPALFQHTGIFTGPYLRFEFDRPQTHKEIKQ